MNPLAPIRAERGAISRLARELGVTRGAVCHWIDSRVPAERAPAVARLTGIPLHTLRPDLFHAPEPTGSVLSNPMHVSVSGKAGVIKMDEAP